MPLSGGSACDDKSLFFSPTLFRSGGPPRPTRKRRANESNDGPCTRILLGEEIGIRGKRGKYEGQQSDENVNHGGGESKNATVKAKKAKHLTFSLSWRKYVRITEISEKAGRSSFFSGGKSINPHRCANQHTSKSSSFSSPPSAYTANSTVNIVYRPRLLFSKPCFPLTFLQVFYGVPP